MTFPVVFHLFGIPLHAHLVFETLAYTLGFQLFLSLRRWSPSASVPFEQMAWILVGAVVGALVGSKVLAWIEHPRVYLAHFDDPQRWLGGKTIVGGLLGGWAGVEFAKWAVRVRGNTGDLYVYPLALAIAVGRVGCFFGKTRIEDALLAIDRQLYNADAHWNGTRPGFGGDGLFVFLRLSPDARRFAIDYRLRDGWIILNPGSDKFIGPTIAWRTIVLDVDTDGRVSRVTSEETKGETFGTAA